MKRRAAWIVSIAGTIFAMFGTAGALNVDAQATTGAYDENEPYTYLHLTVDNPDTFDTGYDMTILPGESKIYLGNQQLPPGGKKTYHLALPLWGHPSSIFFRDAHGTFSRGATQSQKTILNISNMETWPSEKESVDFTTRLNQLGITPTGAYPGRAWFKPSTPSTPPTDNWVLNRTPDDVPDNWKCYTPFQAVFLSESAFNTMSQSGALPPLMDYVAMGGKVGVYDSATTHSEHVQLGKIDYQKNNPVKLANDPSQTTECLKVLLSHDTTPEWKKFLGRKDDTVGNFPYNVKGGVGKIGGLILATIFFIVAGPVSLFYAEKKKKNIRVLLRILPILSIAACLTMMIYFLVGQGFIRRGGAMSLTLLDENRASALTFSHHVVMSGLYPLNGFRFGTDTAFVPMNVNLEQDNYDITLLPDGMVLSSGLFKPSVNFHYFTATPEKTRERLIFDADMKTAINGFENPIRFLAVYKDGKLYSAENIVKGGKADLKEDRPDVELVEYFLRRCVQLDSSEVKYFKNHFLAFLTYFVKETGPRYVALMDGRASRSDAGTTIATGKYCHILAGNIGAATANGESGGK
jgi:hypothetical protein